MIIEYVNGQPAAVLEGPHWQLTADVVDAAARLLFGRPDQGPFDAPWDAEMTARGHQIQADRDAYLASLSQRAAAREQAVDALLLLLLRSSPRYVLASPAQRAALEAAHRAALGAPPTRPAIAAA